MYYHKRNAFNSIAILILSLVLIFGFFSSQAIAGSDSGQKVKKEFGEAIEAIKNYSIDKKDDAVKSTKKVMENLDGRIEKLGDRLDKNWDKMDAKAREKAKKTLKSLRRKRNELSEWSGGIAHSSKNAWEDVKTGFSNAYDALGEALNDAEEEF